MHTFVTIKSIRSYLLSERKKGNSIGLVPTMGYLHKGHKALIRESIKINDCTIVSIFVNYFQFNDKNDFDKYPRNINKDTKIIKDSGANAIFAPSNSEMYPTNQYVLLSLPKLTNVLCGISRPGHFEGVCSIVIKLFNVVQPDIAYFGEKDIQQLIIIRKLTQDLNFPIEIKGVSTIRESNGLAMSSRNANLSESTRNKAGFIFKALERGRQLIYSGETNAKLIKAKIEKDLIKNNCKIDYVEIVESKTIQILNEINKDAYIATAVFLEGVRLIDNVFVKNDK